MVVVPVDEHDVGVRVLQLLRSADPGESAAEDDDARACVGCHSRSLPVRLGKAASSVLFARRSSPAQDEGAREGAYERVVARIPQAPVQDAPGSSVIRSVPDRNAFGGHVIGSTAIARRFTSGSGSPVKTIR